MEGWAQFWMIVVFAALGAFGLLSAWVAVAGLGDIKRMFEALARGEDAADQPEEPGD